MNSRRLRVAGITSEGNALQHLRLLQPLQSLYLQGKIEGYNVFSRGLAHGPHRFSEYDAIWIQRNGLGARKLVDWFDRNNFKYLLDLDDLLLAIPAYSSAFNNNVSLLKLMEGCSVLTVSNARLISILEKYSGLDLSHKATITPNGLMFPRKVYSQTDRPTAMMWTSSDKIALHDSYDAVVGAIVDFSRKMDLPIFLAGSFPDDFVSSLENANYLGVMDFWEHKMFLAKQPTMLAVCPLETVGDEKTLDFIASKSDVKIVEYGGFSHPGVYSDCPPYADTDLPAGYTASNTYQSWMTMLKSCYEDGAQAIGEQSSRIREKREIDRIATGCWLPALQKSGLGNPIPHSLLEGRLRKANRNILNVAGAYLGPILPEKAKKPLKSVLNYVLNS